MYKCRIPGTEVGLRKKALAHNMSQMIKSLLGCPHGRNMRITRSCINLYAGLKQIQAIFPSLSFTHTGDQRRVTKGINNQCQWFSASYHQEALSTMICLPRHPCILQRILGCVVRLNVNSCGVKSRPVALRELRVCLECVFPNLVPMLARTCKQVGWLVRAGR